MRTVHLEIVAFSLLCSTLTAFVNVAGENLTSIRSTTVKEVDFGSQWRSVLSEYFAKSRIPKRRSIWKNYSDNFAFHVNTLFYKLR